MKILQTLAGGCALACVMTLLAVDVEAWSAQGHRLVAALAESRLSTAARTQVQALLDGSDLDDVAAWADGFDEGMAQTSSWHYVNIPRDAAGYSRDRDCPRQPGVSAGSRADRWRDCVVERIRYNEERLRDARLDRVDRALALKFLVHLVADVHQPFHAIGDARGGNGIRVTAFGSSDCAVGTGSSPCNLHGIWDGTLLGRRRLNDRQYLAILQTRVKERGLERRSGGTPADWAMESHALARAAFVSDRGIVDEAYYKKHLPALEERLALAGVRLAAMLNGALLEKEEGGRR